MHFDLLKFLLLTKSDTRQTNLTKAHEKTASLQSVLYLVNLLNSRTVTAMYRKHSASEKHRELKS